MPETCSVCYVVEVAESGTVCPACRKKRDDKHKQDRTDRKALIKKVWSGERTNWDQIRPPKRFYNATWDTVPQQLQQQIKPFLDGDVDLLTLAGPAGVGKSWTAWAVLSAFFVDHGGWNGPRFINWFDLNETAQGSRRYGDTGEACLEYLNKLATCELLVIDEFATAKPYEAEFMAVMSVIHSRFDNCRPTILITTKSETELIASLGEATVSRINSGIVVKLTGRDRRLHM